MLRCDFDWAAYNKGRNEDREEAIVKISLIPVPTCGNEEYIT